MKNQMVLHPYYFGQEIEFSLEIYIADEINN